MERRPKRTGLLPRNSGITIFVLVYWIKFLWFRRFPLFDVSLNAAGVVDRVLEASRYWGRVDETCPLDERVIESEVRAGRVFTGRFRSGWLRKVSFEVRGWVLRDLIERRVF
jgi:hypothetical protein